MNKFIYMLLVILVVPAFSQAKDFKKGMDTSQILLENPRYVYGDEWLDVNVTLSQLSQDYDGLDIELDPDSVPLNSDFMSDDPACSIEKSKSGISTIHFDLKGVLTNSLKSPKLKEAKLHFKIKFSGKSYGCLIKDTAFLKVGDKERKKVPFGSSGFECFVIDPLWKGQFEKVFAEAETALLNELAEDMNVGLDSKLITEHKRNIDSKYILHFGDFLNSGSDQLLIEMGDYLGAGGSLYGVYVFDIVKNSYQRLFSKTGYVLKRDILKWDGHTGFLLADENWNEDVDSKANLYIYENGSFVSAFSYSYGRAALHMGWNYFTCLDDSGPSLCLYQFNGTIGTNSFYTCYDIQKFQLTWNENDKKFTVGPSTPVDAGERDGFKNSSIWHKHLAEGIIGKFPDTCESSNENEK